MAANILERYGIKEVADVTFLKIESDGTATVPVLYLDTLKVSTIEETAEQADARGGKGNPKLITWDYGKEITLTLQDALYSPKSMALMHSGIRDTSTADEKSYAFDGLSNSTETETITKYINYTATSEKIPDVAALLKAHKIKDTESTYITNITVYSSTDGKKITEDNLVKGLTYTVGYEISIVDRSTITISADSFPGTYKVIGDTYARSYTSGEDEYYQFIIYKAKMSAEVTITLEAEGDPSVFDMTLNVLRPEDGVMMELVQYKVGKTTTTGE